jgi:hypothetical protein
MRADAPRPAESFGNEYTNYLVDLPWSSMADKNAIMDEIWCRPGKTGIVVFLVGLHWQAMYSGAGKKWASNIERVETIFNAILEAPSLYVHFLPLSFTISTHFWQATCQTRTSGKQWDGVTIDQQAHSEQGIGH